MFDKILSLEGLLLTGAGTAHLLYALFYLDWSAFPLALSAGATAIGSVYFIAGILLLLGYSQILIPIFAVNALGFTAVLLTGPTSPFYPIDPYLMIVDCISLPALA